MCRKLHVSLYGTLDAAQNWEETYSQWLIKLGFRRGRASPCVFYNHTRNIRVVVHGDDFTCLGFQEGLDWLRDEFRRKFTVKFKARLGPQEDDDKSVQILNRIVTWTKLGIEYEPDQRHAEIIVDELGQRGKKAVVTPGVKAGNEKEEEQDEMDLDQGDAERYRSAVARGNYLSQDRLDIKYAIKELSR